MEIVRTFVDVALSGYAFIIVGCGMIAAPLLWRQKLAFHKIACMGVPVWFKISRGVLIATFGINLLVTSPGYLQFALALALAIAISVWRPWFSVVGENKGDKSHFQEKAGDKP